MLLDTESGLRVLHSELQAFLKSQAQSRDFVASTDRSPQPYDEFLPGLRVVKSAGDLALQQTADRWLVLSGSDATLSACARTFLVSESQGHKHLYAAPVSLIVEADNYWESDGAR